MRRDRLHRNDTNRIENIYQLHFHSHKMNDHDELCPPPSADDDDLTLPRASINKMIKELVCVVFMSSLFVDIFVVCSGCLIICVINFFFVFMCAGAVNTSGQRKS